MLKGQFPNDSPTDFEVTWAKCVVGYASTYIIIIFVTSAKHYNIIII